MHNVIYYHTKNNKCPFDEWFSSLDNSVQIRIIKRINRIYDNNLAITKKLIMIYMKCDLVMVPVIGSIILLLII